MKNVKIMCEMVGCKKEAKFILRRFECRDYVVCKKHKDLAKVFIVKNI